MDEWGEVVTLTYECPCGFTTSRTFMHLDPDEFVQLRHFCPITR